MKIFNRNNIILFLQSLPIIWLFSGFFITVDAVNIIIPLTLLCLITQFFKPESNISYIPKFFLFTIICLTLHILISDRIHDASTQEIRGYIIALVMLFVVVTPEKILEKKHWLLLIASTCSILYCLYFSVYIPTRRAEWPINAIPYSTMTVLIASISLILAIYKPKHKLINWLAFLFSIIAIVLAESRGPILALTCSIFIILIPLIKRHKFSYKLLIPVLLAIITSSYLLAPLLTDRYQQTKNEINLISNGKYKSSIGIRLELWQVAIKNIKEKPITGTGRDLKKQISTMYKNKEISKYAYYFSPSHYHNQYLDAWAKNGIIFFILIIILLFYPVYYYLKNRNTTSFMSYNISIIYIVTSLTDVPLHSSSGIIIYVFLQCLLLGNDRQVKNNIFSRFNKAFTNLKTRPLKL